MTLSLPRRYMVRYFPAEIFHQGNRPDNSDKQVVSRCVHTGYRNKRESEIALWSAKQRDNGRARALTSVHTGVLSTPLRLHFSDVGPRAPATIYALSSGHGRSGVAVVRVSGTEAGRVLMSLTRRSLPPPRKAILAKLYHPVSQEKLDKALVLWFPGPHSFTGEDSCELHIHGGAAVIQSVLGALGHMPGCQAAEAGQFTKRAFSNGKLDLTEVEGLSDLIHAETEAQRKQALRQMEGDLTRLYTAWRARLLKCIANVEAFIDFSEEENIEDGILTTVDEEVVSITEEIEHHLADNRRGERLRVGVHVTIMGQTNVGKSTLMNFLCQRPAAIVSPVAGTTRDVVETAVNLGGFPVLLSDTAGLRETEDVVEQEGVKRALKRIEEADLKIVVLDSTQLVDKWSLDSKNFSRFLSQQLNLFGDENNFEHESEELIVVLNKNDLHKISVQGISIPENVKLCSVSCKTNEGMDDFLEILQNKIEKLCGDPSVGSPSLTQSRHRQHLTQCLHDLQQFKDAVSQDQVLAAHHLRKAIRNIGKITGKISTEEILDVIFRDFCIGK